MRQLSLAQELWTVVKDGDDTARDIFAGHYSRRYYLDGRNPKLFVGPGRKLVLVSPDARALFIWRLFLDDAIPKQTGVNCAVFRNEGSRLSSELIREADRLAFEIFAGENRHYTYVNPDKVRRKRDPGRCFLRAGWKHAGWTKGGLRILELWRKTA